MLTINQVKQYLISFFKNHLQINTVVYDSDFNFNADDDILYKVAQIQPVDPVQTSYKEVIYKFKVVIADILNPNNNDSENDIQSDCISIANDFISYFGDEDFQDFYFDKGINIQTFTEKNGDRIAGCVFAFGVRQTRLFNPCIIPLANPFTGVSFTGNVTNVYSYYNLLAPYLTIVSASTLFQPKGNYLTGTTVDFSDYYTKEQANALFLTGYTPDLSNYYTKSQSDSKYQLLGNYVSASTLNNYQLAGNYVSASTLANYLPVGNYVSASTLSNYLTTTQIGAAYQAIGNYVSASTLANYQLAGNYVSASTLSSYQLAGNYVSASTLANYQLAGNYVSASTLSSYLTSSQISAAYQAIGNYVSASTLANYQLVGNYVSASTLASYQLAGNYVSASTLSQYQTSIVLTTSGTSGVATLNGSYLNIPQYAGGGVTLSATSPLSYNSGTGVFSILSANTSQSGYLLSTDWNTFNNKQPQLSGTGYTKFLGTTASYISSIPNSDLTNSSITIQGNNVALGGSINVLNGTGFTKVVGTTISYDNTVYQPALALTTSGTSGAATFDGINLNVPQYAGTTYTASNGLSLTGSTFGLGGTLTQNTNTEMSGKTFKFTDTIGTDKFSVGNGNFSIKEGVSATTNSFLTITSGAFSGGNYIAGTNDNYSFFCNNASISLNYAQNSSGTTKQISISPTAIQIYDSVSLKGMVYGADYSTSGKTDNRWIPDYGAVKSYVSGATSGFTNITLSTSGSSGASTLNSGYLNVPTYTLAGLGGQPLITLTTSGNSGSAVLTTANTMNIPTYTLAGLGGISLTSLSATSPLSYNNATGAFTIQSANTSQSGYLVSTDWNTFNNKQAQLNGTGYTKFNGTSVSYNATIPNSDLTNSFVTIQGSSVALGGSLNILNGTGFVKAAGTSISYDNTTYQAAITLTTSGTSGAATLNSGYLNIPQYAGGGTAANPSASVGLSAVNGAASTYMRSDAAPALSQTIVPTWTGIHTFSVTNTASATATTNVGTLVNHTINQSGAANFTDLLVNRISTSAGTGTQRLLDLQVNGSSTFSVNSGGYLQATNGATLGATQFQVFNQQNTLTDGAYLWNTASSTSSKPVVPSLNLRFQGSVWNTTATAAANYFSYINYATGVSGNTPTSTLVWAGSLTNSFTTPSYSTIMSLSSTGILTLQAPVVTKGYTVSTLPGGVQGMMCYVTDSNSSSVGIIVSGSGSNVKPVFYNGTNWVTM